jgi:hypothetical protein
VSGVNEGNCEDIVPSWDIGVGVERKELVGKGEDNSDADVEADANEDIEVAAW